MRLPASFRKSETSKIIWLYDWHSIGQGRGASDTYGTVEDQAGEDQVRPTPIEVLQQHSSERGEGEGSEP